MFYITLFVYTTGTELWSADPSMTDIRWNYYQPQVIPDLDGDGVPDVVVSHGGNGEYTAMVGSLNNLFYR